LVVLFIFGFIVGFYAAIKACFDFLVRLCTGQERRTWRETEREHEQKFHAKTPKNEDTELATPEN
jgi:hypothetical protein